MAKFYIESGNFRDIINSSTYMRAIIFSIKRLSKQQENGENLGIKFAHTISINELGFPTDLLDKENLKLFDIRYLKKRKENYVSFKKGSIFEIPYQPGDTLFLPTEPIIKMIDV